MDISEDCAVAAVASLVAANVDEDVCWVDLLELWSSFAAEDSDTGAGCAAPVDAEEGAGRIESRVAGDMRVGEGREDLDEERRSRAAKSCGDRTGDDCEAALA